MLLYLSNVSNKDNTVEKMYFFPKYHRISIYFLNHTFNFSKFQYSNNNKYIFPHVFRGFLHIFECMVCKYVYNLFSKFQMFDIKTDFQ